MAFSFPGVYPFQGVGSTLMFSTLCLWSLYENLLLEDPVQFKRTRFPNFLFIELLAVNIVVVADSIVWELSGEQLLLFRHGSRVELVQASRVLAELSLQSAEDRSHERHRVLGRCCRAASSDELHVSVLLAAFLVGAASSQDLCDLLR